MQLPDLSNNAALWLGMRQAESLRQALLATLNGKPLTHLTVRKWLEAQNVDCPADFPEETLVWNALNTGFQDGFGIHPEMLVRGSNTPDPDWVEGGAERSGAGWRNPANFLITSAFVRLLGAWEQFELDVLKTLFYYRPLGLLGGELEQTVEIAKPDVIREVPVAEGDKLIFQKPPVWTWLRKHAEGNPERAKIFKNVFGITTLPDGYTNKQRDAWYENRNAIAHGRAGVTMTLVEYIDVDVFVAKAMTHVSTQCLLKLKLRV